MLRFCLDIALGMQYLHAGGGAPGTPPILHRDLKSPNILVGEDSDGQLLKIVDFGLARVKEMDSKGGTQQMTQAGTPYWTAPEVLILLGCLYMQRVITITLQCC